MREYGITTSQAHYWIHVCPKDAAFYLYPKVKMLDVLSRFKAWNGPTSKGFLVPIIPNLRENNGIIRPYDFSTTGGYKIFSQWTWKGKTDRKVGEMGEECFQWFAEAGEFCLPVHASFLSGKSLQYKGMDFYCQLLKPKVSIEVKADVKGGIWGSGNLFVQTHELQHKRGSK